MEFKNFIPESWTQFKTLFKKFFKKTFVGTRAEWDALTLAEKQEYDIANITDDTAGGELVVTDAVTDGDLNPVTSNAVYDVTHITSLIVQSTDSISTLLKSMGDRQIAFVNTPVSGFNAVNIQITYLLGIMTRLDAGYQFNGFAMSGNTRYNVALWFNNSEVTVANPEYSALNQSV